MIDDKITDLPEVNPLSPVDLDLVDPNFLINFITDESSCGEVFVLDRDSFVTLINKSFKNSISYDVRWSMMLGRTAKTFIIDGEEVSSEIFFDLMSKKYPDYLKWIMFNLEMLLPEKI